MWNSHTVPQCVNINSKFTIFNALVVLTQHDKLIRFEKYIVWSNKTNPQIGSTTGSLEAAYTQATGKRVSLSEQQLVDCASAFNNFGCNGGLPSQAFEYIKYNGGLDTEQSYPYAAVNGVCRFKPENVGVKVLDSVNITLVRNLYPLSPSIRCCSSIWPPVRLTSS